MVNYTNAKAVSHKTSTTTLARQLKQFSIAFKKKHPLRKIEPQIRIDRKRQTFKLEMSGFLTRKVFQNLEFPPSMGLYDATESG